jgi:hypothetical protein
VELGKKYGVEDKRKRKLPLVPFFWLMVLSAIEADSRAICQKRSVEIFTAFFLTHLSELIRGIKSNYNYLKSKFLQTCEFLPASLLSW